LFCAEKKKMTTVSWEKDTCRVNGGGGGGGGYLGPQVCSKTCAGEFRRKQNSLLKMSPCFSSTVVVCWFNVWVYVCVFDIPLSFSLHTGKGLGVEGTEVLASTVAKFLKAANGVVAITEMYL